MEKNTDSSQKYTLFSSSCGTLTTKCCKTNLTKFKRIKIKHYLLSDYNQIKIKMNNIKTKQNIWRLNNTILNHTCIKKEISRKFLKYFALNENENETSKFVGCRENSA